MISNIPFQILSAKLTPFTSFFVLAVHGLFAISHTVNQVDVNVLPQPSRVLNPPTPTVEIISQDKPSFSLQATLALSCAAITIITCAATWTRSPAHPPNKYGRLRKAVSPPPGPLPPQENAGNDANANDGADEEEQNDGDGGDNGDPQDGVDANDEDILYDNLATDAAPAPEDPPPPPDNVDEDDGDDGFLLLNNDLGWLILLVLGRLASKIFNRKQAQLQSAHVINPRVTQHPTPMINSVDIQSPVVKSLIVADGRQKSSAINGLLRRPCTPPRPPPIKDSPPEPPLFIPTVVQDVDPGLPSATTHRVAHRPLSWTSWFLLALLPALGFFGSVISLLFTLELETPISQAYNSQQHHTPYDQAQTGPELPPPLSRRAQISKPSLSFSASLPTSPPPLPPASPRLVPLPPSPTQDSASKIIRSKVVERIWVETARRLAREPEEDREEAQRKRQLSGLQKEIWRKLYELRIEDGGRAAQECGMNGDYGAQTRLSSMGGKWLSE
ncbi:hypothetical protein R3P38DRAFT_2976391 [Favolaschia claudopus]|uniref:Transmembrane protein n=1 Tax=Favolaschia claudopus TaxID=2862362 RepID=A0AAW0B246_9AGAR